MKIVRFEVNPFGENTYVVYDEKSNEAVVIDPGMMNQNERDGVVNFLTGHDLHVKHVLITHVHIDHVASAAWLAHQCSAPVCASEADAPLSAALPAQAQRFGLKIQIEPLSVDKYVKEGDKLHVGDEDIHVIAVPGHSLGGLAFYLPQSSVVFVGDSVFLGSIGRTDLPGGSQPQLIQSVKSKILTLPADTIVLPGHGPSTTVGAELSTNPYLQ